MNKHMAGVKMLSFQKFNTNRNVLDHIIIEGFRDIPFEIKRIFYIFGEGNVGLIRGKHANRRSEFVLFNVSGKCKVKIIDEEKNEVIYELNHRYEAIYLPKMIWKEMYDFTEDSVLMVLANEYYDPQEYIRSFDDFVEELKLET